MVRRLTPTECEALQGFPAGWTVPTGCSLAGSLQDLAAVPRASPSGLPRRVDVGAFNLRGRDDGAQPEPDDLASLRASSGGSSRSYVYGDAESSDRCALDPPPDGPRYAACGDAVTVPVATWIFERLVAYGEENLR